VSGNLPNTCVSLFDAALPGTLPQLNRYIYTLTHLLTHLLLDECT
jgi:Asp-tRNA(Asn)/Glu-tRNA(Gln) amidotransferase B subunit